MNKNIVYWITNSKYEMPESENWTNFPLFGIGSPLSFKEHVECAKVFYQKECPTRYAVIVDTDNKEELELVNSHFLSNNIINVSKGYDIGKIVKQIEWIMSDFGTDRKMDNNVFFISDTHFSHNNIIRYCNRPWNSGKDSNGDLVVSEDDVERMNEDMVRNWNSVVGKDDIVWHLGDFCLGKNQNERIPELVSRLNGKINLVMGNHDHHSVKFYYEAGFNRVYDRKIIINDFVVLSHAPMEFVKGPFFNIYGHVHDCESYKTWSKDSCCVCVERHNYTPVSWKEIMKHYDELNKGNE